MIATAAIAAMLAAIAIVTTYDRRIAAIFVGSAAVVFVLLRLVARADHGAGPPPAAAAFDRCCGSPSPISTGRAR